MLTTDSIRPSPDATRLECTKASLESVLTAPTQSLEGNGRKKFKKLSDAIANQIQSTPTTQRTVLESRKKHRRETLG